MEWLYSVEPERIIQGVIIDTRNGPYIKDHIYTDMTEDIREQTGYRGLEIRNDKLNEFLEGLLEE